MGIKGKELFEQVLGPTLYLPGSKGKVLVMTKRARLGLPLSHPEDAKIPLGTNPQESEVSISPSCDHVNPYQLDRNFRAYVAKLESFRANHRG